MQTLLKLRGECFGNVLRAAVEPQRLRSARSKPLTSAEQKTFKRRPGKVRDGIEHGDQVILSKTLWLMMAAGSLIERAGQPRD
ncbi:hypothetical protein [Brevundimonas sp.]